MRKFRTFFEMEIDVEFDNPEKAEAFFIDGDWKKSFWTFDDLDEVAESIANSFHWENDHWDKDYKKTAKFLEGYGNFIRIKPDVWESCPSSIDECGKITIRINMELDPVGH